MDFYEFLPQKLSCEDLLIEVIKLWPPPIKDLVDHPHLTIGSCFSVHYRIMEHAGSLESTKEA